MIDEVRHSTIQQNLKRLYMQNYIDPAGFNSSLRNFQDDYCGTIGRQFAEGFITGDAITAASIYLTIVAETAFTNTLFVAMPAEAAANLKPGPGPQAMVDALLSATELPAAADTPAARPQTKVYLWQFDSTRPSPIESIKDVTPGLLTQYPPLAAAVVFDHWAPSETWGLMGGCFRYRVVVTGSVPPTASTFGLAANTLCSTPPSPSSSPKSKASP